MFACRQFPGQSSESWVADLVPNRSRSKSGLQGHSDVFIIYYLLDIRHLVSATTPRLDPTVIFTTLRDSRYSIRQNVRIAHGFSRYLLENIVM